jgi:hypothetical protein
MVSCVIKNSVKYALKNILIFKIILTIEYFSIFIELIMSIYKLSNMYQVNFELNLFSGNYYKNDYFYFLTFFSPHLWIKSIYTCETLNTQNFCYFPKDKFSILIMIYLTLLIVIILIAVLYTDSKKLIRKTNFFLNFLSGFSHFMIEIVYFKILAMSIIYILLNSLISSAYLLDSDLSLNIFFIVFSVILLTIFLITNFIFIKYFNIIVKFSDSYPYDNYFSTTYDYFLICLKIAIALENNVYTFSGRLTQPLKILNAVILIFSFSFLLITIKTLIYKKTLYFINNRLNIFRIGLIIHLSSVIFYYIIFNTPKNIINNIVTLVFTIVILPLLSGYISGIIGERNLIMIYFEKNIIIILAYLLNYKNSLFIFENSETNKNKLSSKQDLMRQLIFNRQIDTIFIQHKNICAYANCEICNLNSISFKLLGEALFNQCQILISQNTVEDLTIKYFDLVKLLFYFHMDNEKRIKIYFEAIKSEQRHRNNLEIFINISLLKEIICQSKKEHTRVFLLLKKYEKVNILSEQAIDAIKDFLLCSSKGGINLNNTIDKVNKIRDKLESSISFISKNRDIYIDDYGLVIGRFIYSSLFNTELSDSLMNYTIDQFEERLDILFNSNHILMKYNDIQNCLIILSGTKDFASYRNKPLNSILIEEIKFEKELKKQLKNVKGYEFEYPFIIKSDNDYIKYINSKNKVIQSINHKDLYIISSFDIKERELILVKENPLSPRRDYVSFACPNKINLGQTLFNFSEDMNKFIYLKPQWLSYLRKNHNNVILSELLTESTLKSSKSDTDYLDILYPKYQRAHLAISKIATNICGLDDSDKDLLQLYIGEIADNVVNNKSINFKIRLIKTFIGEKEIYNLYRVKQLKQIIYSKASHQEDSIVTESSNNEINKTTTSFTSGTQLSDLAIQKSMKTNIEKNTMVLTRYSRFTVVFNLLMVVYCIIFLNIGMSNNNRFNQLFEIRNNYLKTKNMFFHTSMTIFHNTKIINNYKYYKDEADNYLISEMPAKISSLSGALNALKDSLYSYSFNQDIQFMFDKELMYSIIIDKDTKILLNQEPLKFLDIFYIFLSNCNTFYENLQKDYLYINTFKLYNNEIKIDSEGELDDLQVYTFKVYELVMNYYLYFNSLAELEALLDKEQSLNVSTQLYVTMGLTFALVGLHFILIFICNKIIEFLNNIINNNNQLLREVLNTYIMKFLMLKLNTLASLNHYYKDNPIKSLGMLKHIKKDYGVNTKKDKISEFKTPKPKQAVIVDEKSTFINKATYLNPIKKTLTFTFMAYFIYSIGIYLLLVKSFTNIDSTTNYIFVNSKVFNSLYNNALLTKFIIIQNTTDTELATYMKVNDHTYIEDGYLSTAIVKLVNMSSVLVVRKQQSSIINHYYTLYGEQMMSCTDRIDLFNDKIIMTTVNGDNATIDLLKAECAKFPIMKKDIDQFYFDFNYRTLHIINSIKVFNNYKEKVIEIYDTSIKELYYMVLFLFRPVQSFILYKINIEGISQANNNYLSFTFIFFSLNILVDIIICFIVNKFIVDRSRKINNDLNTMINCLKI